MTVDQIEELIRRLIAAGFAVAVVLVAPGGGVPDAPGATVVTVAPSPSGSAGATPVTPTPVTPTPTAPTPTAPRSPAPTSRTGTPTTTPTTTSSDRTGAGGADPDGTSGPSAPSTTSTTRTTPADGATAAATHGWGTPDREDDFSRGTGQWSIYDGPGHAGQGRRSPSAVSVAGGVLTLTGDASGTTAGLAWNPGQKYGRWEGRIKAPVSDPSYNALMLLWPDAENWPVGGEVDFMEMTDEARRSTDFFLHYGADNSQVHGEVRIDATQWHSWAVEWTPESITGYVDGKQWYRTTDTSTFPPGPMHLCIQLDWFPKGSTPKESAMQVDWVRQYPLSARAQ